MSNFEKQAKKSLENVGQSEHDKGFYDFLQKLTVPKRALDELKQREVDEGECFFDNETYG